MWRRTFHASKINFLHFPDAASQYRNIREIFINFILSLWIEFKSCWQELSWIHNSTEFQTSNSRELNAILNFLDVSSWIVEIDFIFSDIIAFEIFGVVFNKNVSSEEIKIAMNWQHSVEELHPTQLQVSISFHFPISQAKPTFNSIRFRDSTSSFKNCSSEFSSSNYYGKMWNFHFVKSFVLFLPNRNAISNIIFSRSHCFLIQHNVHKIKFQVAKNDYIIVMITAGTSGSGDECSWLQRNHQRLPWYSFFWIFEVVLVSRLTRFIANNFYRQQRQDFFPFFIRSSSFPVSETPTLLAA